MNGITLLTFFVLAVFVGFEVVSKVSTTLHTPLMSGANAIHGVILVGSILVTGATTSTPALILGLIAVVLATINMVGGFVVTDRMLQMFKARTPKPTAKKADDGVVRASDSRAGGGGAGDAGSEPKKGRA